MIRVALAGNPNVGKTELFNRLTGMKQHVGNWPGVTVEKKTGTFVHKGETIEIIDLPGTYSLTTQAADEMIARDFILNEKPDAIINIVDGINIERNLYLTVLLLELEANMVMALNRWDMVKARGVEIDIERLSKIIGIPVVPTVAPTGEGIDDLKDAVIEAARTGSKGDTAVIKYGEEIERLIGAIEKRICRDGLLKDYPSRWLAIKALERDEEVLGWLMKSNPGLIETLRAVD